MKNTSAILLMMMLCIFLTSFKKLPSYAAKKYAYVTATEIDKQYNEPGNNGYVDLTTDVVSYECRIGASGIEGQFLEHYNGEEQTVNRKLVYEAPVSAWVYDTYDKAVASRRGWIANKQTGKHKRTVRGFSVTCE